MEASKNKIEEKLKKTEMEVETERILRRKKKIKEKNETSKINDITSRLTRNIEYLQNKIKMLEKEKFNLEGKFSKKSFKRQNTGNNSVINEGKNLTTKTINPFLKKKNKKSVINRSQSNAAIISKSKISEKHLSSHNDGRDHSINFKQSIPQLNLSGITQGSPVSSSRLFSTRSKKKNFNRTNTSTTNISISNSVTGLRKNNIIGTQGDGSSKY